MKQYEDKLKVLHEHIKSMVQDRESGVSLNNKRHDITDELLGFAADLASAELKAGRIGKKEFLTTKDVYASRLMGDLEEATRSLYRN